MTRSTRTTDMNDIKGILSEHAQGAGEIHALEQTAARLEQVLTREVSYRPEFKAQLRRQLMAQASPQVLPWYRRAAVWGSGLGLVAAAVVLVVGLQLLQSETEPPQGIAAQPTSPHEVAPGPSITLAPRLVGLQNLTTPEIPDEVIQPTSPEVDLANLPDVQQGLRVYTLTARPNEEQFTDLAVRFGVAAMIQPVDRGFKAVDQDRTLEMTLDGLVEYADRSLPAADAVAVTDAVEARAIARRFLDQAALPIPDLQPVVHEERAGANVVAFTVSYAPRIDRMPVVNGKTLIRVTSQGQVDRAEAYVASGHQSTVPYAVIAKEKAILTAKERGGFFPISDVSDLVLVRTVSDGTVFLQPYWRVFGQNSAGVKVARYVPALDR